MDYTDQYIDDLRLYMANDSHNFTRCVINELDVVRPGEALSLNFNDCTLSLAVLEHVYPFIGQFANCHVLLDDNTTVLADGVPYITRDLRPWVTYVFTDSIKVGCQHYTKAEWAEMPLIHIGSFALGAMDLAEQHRDYLLSL